jgi:hypothetical protein
VNFCETAAVSFFTREARGDKRADDVEREFDANYARAENQHVAVVVFA